MLWPPRIHQRAAHEDGVGEREQAAQLADGIEQKHAGERERRIAGEVGAPQMRDSGGFELGGGIVKRGGFARREDQQQAGMIRR